MKTTKEDELEALLIKKDDQISRMEAFIDAQKWDIEEKVKYMHYFCDKSRERKDTISKYLSIIRTMNRTLSEFVPDTNILLLDYTGMQEVVRKIQSGE